MQFCLYGSLGPTKLDMVELAVSAGGTWCMQKCRGMCKNLTNNDAC